METEFCVGQNQKTMEETIYERDEF